MNLENSAAPSEASGQGESTPSESGQGPVTPSDTSGQGTQQIGNSTSQVAETQPSGLSEAALAEIDKRTSHFNNKIAEQSYQRKQLETQLQQLQQQQEQRNQALGQALGFVQPQQQTDIVSELIDNPARLQEIIQQEAQKMMEPLQQKLTTRETNEFLQTQLNEKSQIKESLKATGRFSDQFIEQALDVTNLVDPQVFRDQAKLQDPMVSPEEKAQINAQIEQGIADFIRQSGGIRRLVHAKLGEQFTSNLDDITQQLVQSERQKQFAMNRNQSFAGMSGGAATQQANRGNVNYRTEYR
jgi:hypothetical protein